MDRVIGNYTGQDNRSFPLDCETLEAIQNNIDLLGALGNMVGDKTILSGCDVKTGGGRDEGYVFLKTEAYPMGEVLHFIGSNEDSGYLHLATFSSDVTQGDVTYMGAYTIRQVIQGEGEEQWAWEELNVPVDIEAIAASLRSQMSGLMEVVARIKPVPLGVVEMYCGSSIPENYGACDGQALSKELYPELYEVIGTRFNTPNTASNMFCLPDLRGRFVVGQSPNADYNTIGNTGGEEKHVLTPDETAMIAHNHTASCSIDGDHCHKILSENGNDGGDGQHELGTGDNNKWTETAGAHSHTITIGSTTSVNASVAHENRPPYFVLLYIMRLK